MSNENYRYKFANVPFDQPGSAFTNTGFVSRRGATRKHLDARMEARFSLEKDARTCVIDAGTKVGSDLASIFTGFATKEYGERAVFIDRDRQCRFPTGFAGEDDATQMEATL